MRRFKSFHLLAAAAVLAVGAGTLSAADSRDIDHDRRDIRGDYRDMRADYARVNDLEADIARDRARLNEDIRCGRQGAASRDAADLARDQRALDALRRDIRRDHADVWRDRQDLRGDYSYSWR